MLILRKQYTRGIGMSMFKKDQDGFHYVFRGGADLHFQDRHAIIETVGEQLC